MNSEELRAKMNIARGKIVFLKPLLAGPEERVLALLRKIERLVP